MFMVVVFGAGTRWIQVSSTGRDLSGCWAALGSGHEVFHVPLHRLGDHVKLHTSTRPGKAQ